MPRFSQQVLGALANPQYGMLTGQAIANVGQRLSEIPGNIREEQQRRAAQAALQAGLQGYATQDPALLQQAAAASAGAGAGEQAMSMAQAGSELAAQQREEAALNARRNAIAASAEANRLPQVAARARRATSHDTLDQIAKDLRQAEIKKVGEMPVPLKKQLAQAAGVSPAQFDDLGLATVSEDAFNKYISGLEGDLKPWMTSNGDIQVYRESKYGTVWDDVSKSWKNPGDLGLKEAPPTVQKVENIAQGLQEKLTDLGAENFKELSTQAVQSRESVMSIDRILPTVDNMYTGTLAEIKLKTAKLFNQLGLPIDDLSRITDTEVFIAESGKRVADYIKNLGSGTGLSDKDLAFTLQVVGGDIGVDASSLKKILTEFRSAAVRKIKGYNDMRTNVFSRMGDSPDASLTEAFYPAVIIPAMSSPGTAALISEEEFLAMTEAEQNAYLESQGL